MFKISKPLYLFLAAGAIVAQSAAHSRATAQSPSPTQGPRVQEERTSPPTSPSERRDEPNASQSRPDNDRRGQTRVDQQAIDWLIIDQQSMIELVDLGLAKTKTPEVRELAEMVKQDHSNLLAALQEKASSLRASAATSNTSESDNGREVSRPEPETTSTLPGAGQPQGTDSVRAEARRAEREAIRESERDASNERQAPENLADRVGDRAQNLADRTRNAAEGVRDAIDRNLGPEATPNSTPERRELLRRAGGEVANVIRSTNEMGSGVHRQISSQLIVLAERELQERNGKELDGAFLGMLTASHLREEATLVTLIKRVSPELRPTLDSALEKTRQHRQQLESLMSELSY